MPVSDAIVIGAAILPESDFEENTLYEEWADGLDTISTDAALGSSQGRWKSGLYSHHTSQYGMDYGERSVINNERQIYVSPDRPHPSGYSPYSIRNGNLVITSRLVDIYNTAEVAWARNKTYHLTPDGQNAPLSFFTAANGYPSGPPSEWGTYQEEGAGGPLLFDSYPMKYISGMLSTFGNRHAISFGRRECRARLAYGADGASTDINQRSAIFPAIWDLQAIFVGEGVNGEPTSNPATTTYTPFTNSGQLTELDWSEAFGNSTQDLHMTVHYHADTDKKQIAYTYQSGLNIASMHTYTMDVTPEKIGFAVNGIYRQVVTTPVEMDRAMPIYNTISSQPYNVVRDGSGYGVLSPYTQEHPDTSDKYMQFCTLINLARDGKYPRDLARDYYTNPNLQNPSHTDNAEIEIEYIRAAPLTTSPDTNPVRAVAGMVGSGTPPAPDVEPPPSINTRNTFYIVGPRLGVNGTTNRYHVVVPEGHAITEYTYSWSTGLANAMIVSGADQYECWVYFTADVGVDDVSTITCDVT